LEKIDAFSAESIDFSRSFLALKVKCFQPYFAIFLTLFSPTVKTLQNPNLGWKRGIF
jgi:hypothetical protein